MRRILFAILLALPGPAQAHSRSLHPEAGAMCRAACAQSAGRRANVAQACAFRCAATVAHLEAHRAAPPRTTA